jgi:hypothetical protein
MNWNPMKPGTTRAVKGVALVTASLLLAPFALRAESPKDEQETARDKQQREAYLKALPYPGGVKEESDLISMHSLRMLYLMSYPTGKIPPSFRTEAEAHVRAEVGDAAVWQEPGLVPPSQRGGMKNMTGEAVIAPGTNTWVSYGPQPLDSVGTTNNAYQYGTVAGRVSVGGLAVDPTDSNIAYAGFTAGGAWKTTNLGAATPTWTPLWDDKDFVTQSAGAIEIDPNNHNVVYFGTGDFDANDQFGEGIMKTTDGGTTWTQLGADVFTPYSPSVPVGGNRWGNQNIRVIKVDPKSSSRIVVGTRYDLYITHDGGANWQICGFGANHTDPSASNPTFTTIHRISSLILDSRGATTVGYVAVGYYANNGNGDNGVYRFTMPTSGCPSSFTLLNAGFPAGTGSGVNNANGGSTTGRIELAAGTGTDNAMTIYAQVSKATDQTNEGTYVLRPDGGSTTWTKLSGPTWGTCSSGTSGTGQDWYDLFIAVNPANDKDLYIGHIDAFRVTVNSTYTTATASNLTNVYTTSCPSYGKIHPDQHAFTFVGTSGTTFLLGNDGGVYYNNASGAVANWKQINGSFNTNQFYAGQVGKSFATGPQWWFGGMQDNGSSSWDSSKANLTSTARSVGGDGFFTAFDPLAGTETAGWWFTEYTYGSIYCSKNSGADGPFSSGCGPNAYTGSADWSTPFMMDTLHCTNSVCRNLMLGEDYVWAAGAFGVQKPTWKKVSPSLIRSGSTTDSIIAVNMAPSNPKSAATGSAEGKVFWTDGMFTGTSCTQAAANTSTFSCAPLTSATWRDVDSTNSVLPNRAILGVAFDPTDHTRVYAAVGGFNTNTPTTPGHVFEFKWNGSSFTKVDKTGNLPDVPAAGIAVNPLNRKQAFLGTYFGFYFTDDIDAATPVWTRYQWGLPNTVIQYLTVDRGATGTPLQGTTLMAFTYGRGIYAIKLPTGGASFPIH